jgi:hypothetical protein
MSVVGIQCVLVGIYIDLCRSLHLFNSLGQCDYPHAELKQDMSIYINIIILRPHAYAFAHAHARAHAHADAHAHAHAHVHAHAHSHTHNSHTHTRVCGGAQACVAMVLCVRVCDCVCGEVLCVRRGAPTLCVCVVVCAVVRVCMWWCA